MVKARKAVAWAAVWAMALAGNPGLAEEGAKDGGKAAEVANPAGPAASGASAAADPAKEPSLASRIRGALDGRGGAIISLGERAAGSRGAPAGAAGAARRAGPKGAASAPGVRAPAHWGYGGATGPESWASLDPGYGLCAKGERQSPIHIESKDALRGPSDELEFRYRATGASVVNNGHTFEVDLAEGSELVARGEAYRLVQFHLHHPSEEKIDYKGFPMVAHLVHRSEAGRLAVVAVEMELGEANPAIARAWRSLPLDEGDRAGVGVGGMDPSWLLPPEGQRKYFQFMGSLTTPPCSEGVLWLVLKTPMTVSREQLALFTRFFPANARPVQPSHGRLIREQE